MNLSNSSSSSSSYHAHNKSLSIQITIAGMSEENFSKCLDFVNNTTNSKEVVGLIQNSPCRILNCQDGRVSISGKKLTYGYIAKAREKFGLEKMKTIEASKNQRSFVISHLCGTRNCINESHLCLEPKQINDERTHCHFSLRNALGDVKNPSWNNMQMALQAGICKHQPQCCSLNTVKVAPKDDIIIID